MTKTQTILLTSFDSPAVIVPTKQPSSVTGNIIELDMYGKKGYVTCPKRHFIEQFSPYQLGEKLTGKVKCHTCNGYGSGVRIEPPSIDFKDIVCSNCDGKCYLEKEIKLSSNVGEWQLIKVLDSKEGIENMIARGLLKNHKKDSNPTFHNPYVFIVPQDILNER